MLMHKYAYNSEFIANIINYSEEPCVYKLRVVMSLYNLISYSIQITFFFNALNFKFACGLGS